MEAVPICSMGNLVDAINWLDRHSGAASVVLTLVLIVVTARYVGLTRALVVGAREDRAISNAPLLAAELKQDGAQELLVLSNVGFGPALRVQVDPTTRHFRGQLVVDAVESHQHVAVAAGAHLALELRRVKDRLPMDRDLEHPWAELDPQLEAVQYEDERSEADGGEDALEASVPVDPAELFDSPGTMDWAFSDTRWYGADYGAEISVGYCDLSGSTVRRVFMRIMARPADDLEDYADPRATPLKIVTITQSAYSAAQLARRFAYGATAIRRWYDVWRRLRLGDIDALLPPDAEAYRHWT
jgi:hypothetical protein